MVTDPTRIDIAIVTAIGKAATGKMTVTETASGSSRATATAILPTGTMTGWKITIAATGTMI